VRLPISPRPLSYIYIILKTLVNYKTFFKKK
jgi:hypothetical protein